MSINGNTKHLGVQQIFARTVPAQESEYLCFPAKKNYVLLISYYMFKKHVAYS